MSFLKKLASDTAIYGVSSILSRLLNYIILTPYLTRVFTGDAYGEISILYTYAGILTVLFTFRLETAFFRFGNQAEDRDRAFATGTIALLGSTLLLALSAWLFLDPLARAANFADRPDYLLWVVGIIAFDALSALPFARLRIENRPRMFAALKTGNILLNIVFIFLFLEILPLWENGFFREADRVLYVFVANLLASAVVFLLFLPSLSRVRWVWDAGLWRQMFAYALPLVIVGLAGVVNQLIALPLLDYLLPGSVRENRVQTGIYSAASKVAILMNLFTQAFNYAAEPFFFSQMDRQDAQKIYARSTEAFAVAGSVVLLGILLYIDLVQVLIGAGLRQGLGVVPILLLAYFFLGLYYNFSVWYKMADRTLAGALISVAGVVITLALNFWLVPLPQMGYWGSAWAALACYAFMALACLILGQRYYPVPYHLGRVFGLPALALGVYFLSLLPVWLGQDWGMPLKLAVNTGLFLGFGGVVWRVGRVMKENAS